MHRLLEICLDSKRKLTVEDDEVLVSLKQARKQLQLEDGELLEDDWFIEDKIAIAIDLVEAHTGVDWTLTEAEFSIPTATKRVRVLAGNFIEVVEVEELILEEWHPATVEYEVKKGFRYFDFTLDHPVDNPLRVTVKTGVTPAEFPPAVRGAVLIKTEDLYSTDRSGYVIGASVNKLTAFNDLLKSHTRYYY